MLATQRASTWPMNPGRPCLEQQDNLLTLAVVPRHILNDSRVREACAQAIAAHNWPPNARTVRVLTADMNYPVPIPPSEQRSRSALAEPASQNAETEMNTAYNTRGGTPVNYDPSDLQDSRETLLQTGGLFEGQPRVSYYPYPLPEGAGTPSTQSVRSWSSGGLNVAGMRVPPGTPAPSVSGSLFWSHPNAGDVTTFAGQMIPSLSPQQLELVKMVLNAYDASSDRDQSSDVRHNSNPQIRISRAGTPIGNRPPQQDTNPPTGPSTGSKRPYSTSEPDIGTQQTQQGEPNRQTKKHRTEHDEELQSNH